MGKKTGIAWTGSTWNPWYGCEMIDPGCDNCYMFRDMRRFGKDPEVVQRSKTTFDLPLRWKTPKLIFTCSWSDWFHKDADEWRDEAWDIVRKTPHHTYQILTKRHGRIKDHLPPDWPLKNVWLGVSGSENEGFHRRAAALRDVPGDFIRFMSAEPLVGCVGVTPEQLIDYKLDWMIVGGESGKINRPMSIQWVRDLQWACDKAGVPFFLKQLGGYPNKRAEDQAVLDGQTYTEMPHGFKPPAISVL
jgi:protein gp37